MNELPCEVVKDLLPSYLDGLTSEGTARLVKEHLEGCRECADVLDAMRSPDVPEEAGDKAEIDYLKKNRRKGRAVILASAAAVLAAIGALFAIFFLIGQKAGSDSVFASVTVDGNKLKIVGSALGTDRAVSRVEIKEADDGVISVTTRLVRKSPFFKSTFDREFVSSGDIEKVVMNGSTLYGGDRAETLLSDRMKDAVKSSWEEYYENGGSPDLPVLVSYAHPGQCSAKLASWQEAVELLGFVPFNPFENDAEFEKLNYAATGSRDPDGVFYHSVLNWYGGKNGGITNAELRTGYSTDGIRVIYSVTPCYSVNTSGDSLVVYSESGSLYIFETTGLIPESAERYKIMLANMELADLDYVDPDGDGPDEGSGTSLPDPVIKLGTLGPFEKIDAGEGKYIFVQRPEDSKIVYVSFSINDVIYQVELIKGLQDVSDEAMESAIDRVTELVKGMM